METSLWQSSSKFMANPTWLPLPFGENRYFRTMIGSTYTTLQVPGAWNCLPQTDIEMAPFCNMMEGANAESVCTWSTRIRLATSSET